MSKTEATTKIQSSSGALKQEPTAILVVGRSGSGKSYLIKTVCAHLNNYECREWLGTTPDVILRRPAFKERQVVLIDTPGFDNPAMSNYEVFSKLAEFLLHPTRIKLRIAGIIYIHRAGDPINGRAFKQNLGVLSDVFFGDSGISRLTIMVVPKDLGMYRPNTVVQSLACSSTLDDLLRKGARLEASTLDPSDIEGVLRYCFSRDPVLLRIQQDGISKCTRSMHATIGNQIEERLGYCEGESMRRRIEEQAKQFLDSHEKRLKSLEDMLKDREAEIEVSSYTYQQTKEQLAAKEEEALQAQQQLEELQDRHESLLSQLQLEEIQEDDIVMAFEELNRSIGNVGRSISVHLVEGYAKDTFEQDICALTALDACHLSELKTLLRHNDEMSSLVASSDGVGMPVEDFLDYAMRSLLCQHIHKTIFDPFHPTIKPSHNEAIVSMYNEIQLREQQLVAGKWRSSTFKSLFQDETEATSRYRISLVAHQFIEQILTPLINYFFGRETDVWLENEHLDALIQIFQTAWGWNLTLKGDVVSLGNFHPVYYDPFLSFDSSIMNESDPNPQGSQPDYMLGTLGFGLFVSRCAGNGHEPETDVLLKVAVASPSLYA